MSVERPIQRPDGRWRCRYYFKDADGVRRCRSAEGATENAARRAAVELREAERMRAKRIRAGLESPPRPPAPTFAAYVLEHHGAIWPPTQNPQHRAAQVTRLANYAEPVIGGVPVDEVTRAQVRRVLAGALAQGKSPATCNRLVAAMSVVFKHAIDDELRHDNPCARMGMRETGERTEMLELAEVSHVLTAAPPKWRAYFATAFYTGARPSSLRALRVGDLDLVRNTITFRHWKAQGKAQVVALHPELRQHLVPWLGARSADELVWRQFNGQALSPGGYRKAWLWTLEAAGIDRPVVFADLRASFATHLLDAGATADQTRRTMRHRSLTTTQRYVRRSAARGPSAERAAIERVKVPDAHTMQVAGNDAEQRPTNKPTHPL